MTESNPTFAEQFNAEFGEELRKRLKAGDCANCGRSAASHQELSVIARWLNDAGVVEAARSAPPLRRITGDMPFSEPDERVRSKTA